jgi:excisionase family DNA binding protein
LDEPCVKCRKSLDAGERAVEVNRLLLARLHAGPSPLAVPIPCARTDSARRQRKAGSELLSKKEAARRLGVDRATTLEELIASGNIKTVPFKDRVRIPVAEVERILNEGIPQMDASHSKARRPIRVNTPKASDSPGDAIRKLKF